jgi:phosphonoacetate hydrolase
VTVPPQLHRAFSLSRPLTPEYRHRVEAGLLRNFDIFDFVPNGIE